MQSTVVKLDHARGSRSTRILWLLNEIGDPFDLAISDSSLYALHDGGARMHETGAMTEWLCDTRARHLWRGPGQDGRVGWLDWLHFADTILMRAKEGDAAMLKTSFGILDDGLAGDWLLGEFSGVDCQMGYSLWAISQGHDLQSPSLRAYLRRCMGRDAFRRALEG
ncbi:glutathione S-transferase [Cereibacter sp. SYSU M97828]|nr:glutathione S-transferase [Cereibacter flavus]